jgi:hypothetical protein
MFSLLLILAICVGYYYLDLYYPRENKERIYFGGFIAISLLIVYLMNFQPAFIYKLFSELKDMEQKPRYDLDFFYKQQEKDIQNYRI